MLLREHEKDEDAGLAMRGELTDLYLNACGIGEDQAIIVAEFLKLDERVLARSSVPYFAHIGIVQTHGARLGPERSSIRCVNTK